MTIRNQKQTEKFYTRALVDTSSVREDESGGRFFDVVFATETPVFRRGWDENFNEILLCDPQNMRLDRLNEKAVPLLDNHNRYAGALGQYGSVVSYEIKDRECRATIQFSTRDDLAGLWGDIKAGIVKSISAGYNVYRYLRETTGEDKAIPNYRAADWEPMEISLAPVPADFRSKVRADEEGHSIQIDNYSPVQNNTRSMKEGTTIVTTDTPPAVEGANRSTTPADNSAQVRVDERARIVAINSAVRAAGLPADFAQSYIDNGSSADVARAAVLDELARTSAPVVGGPAASARGDERENERRHMVDGLMHRAESGSVGQLTEKARDYQHMPMLTIARHLLAANGESRAYRYSNDEALTRAFATTDFPNLLGDTTQRSLRYFYDKLPFIWKKLASAKSANDFRTITGIAVDTSVDFEEIPQNGKFKEGAIILDDKATSKLKTYGKSISIGRQAILNDDLQVFREIPKTIAQGAARMQSKKFWDLVINNGKAPDGKALFHADHGNLASGVGKVGHVSNALLSNARTAMFRQTTPTGEPMAVSAKYLIVPQEQLTDAQNLLAPVLAAEAAQRNTFAGTFEPLVDPYMTDPDMWFMAADPADVEGIIYTYLSGQEGLNVNSYTDQDSLAVKTNAFIDFDCAIWGYRGWFKNPGK